MFMRIGGSIKHVFFNIQYTINIRLYPHDIPVKSPHGQNRHGSKFYTP